MSNNDLERMMSEEAIMICGEAVEKYGVEDQTWMAVEEIGELLDAIAKSKRGRDTDLVGEIADVFVMITQLAIMNGLEDVRLAIRGKSLRLARRIGLYPPRHADAVQALSAAPPRTVSRPEENDAEKDPYFYPPTSEILKIIQEKKE